MKIKFLCFSIVLIFCQVLYAQHNHGRIEDIPFSSFRITSHECHGLLFRSGSKIFIPANAFVMDNETPCGDMITLKYRELHNAADIIAAGIPMNFTEDNKKKHLESGGMFEIYAECEGKPLKLAKGKEILVRFASNYKTPDLVCYYFDQKSKNWLRRKNPVTDVPVKEEDNFDLWGSNNVPNQIQQTQPIFNDDDVNAPIDPIWKFRDSIKAEVFKSMKIDLMGLYNYDRVIEGEEYIPVVADFILKDGQKITTDIYVVYQDFNTTFYFPGYTWKEQFTLLNRAGIKIFTILPDSRFASVPEEEINKMKIKSLAKQKHTFVLTAQNHNAENSAKLAQLLKLTK